MSAYPKVSKVLRYVDALRGVVIVGFKAHAKELPHCGGLKGANIPMRMHRIDTGKQHENCKRM